MSSIKRRLGMLAVTAGVGLAAIAGTGAAAHADTTPAHHFQPTFTFYDKAGHVSHITGFAVTMYANYTYEWHYIQCFAEGNGIVERIDTHLHARTDGANNLGVYQDASAGIGGSDECSTGAVNASAWHWGVFDYDTSGDPFAYYMDAPGTPGNYVFDNDPISLSANNSHLATVVSTGWTDSVY